MTSEIDMAQHKIHILDDEELELLLEAERKKTNKEWAAVFMKYDFITPTTHETPLAVLTSMRWLMFKEYLRTLKERRELIEQYQIPNPVKAGMPFWL
jgi:hypothetical protein